MKYIIRYGSTKNYFAQMTGIGPAFGATRKTSPRLDTKREAERLIARFPMGAEVMSNVVSVKF